MDKKLIKFSLIFVTGVFISAHLLWQLKLQLPVIHTIKQRQLYRSIRARKKLLKETSLSTKSTSDTKKMKSLLHLLKAQRVVKLPNILKQIKILMKFQFPDLII